MQINTNYDGLVMPNHHLLSTSYNSHNSYSYQQDHNLLSLANGLGQSPYLPAEDLTLCFDGLAVRSPTGSFYSNHNGGIYSPQQIHSPVNIGSPRLGYGSPNSPVFFGGCSPQSTQFNQANFSNTNDQFVPSGSYAGDPINGSFNNHNSFMGGSSFNNNNNSFVGSPSFNNNNSFVGSPNSPTQFLNSPSLAPSYVNSPSLAPTTNTTTPYTTELGIDTSFHQGSYGFTYLSPSLPPQQTQLSPINSPSPTGSYHNNLYLFPPNATTNNNNNYSRPTSPVPDDVILTASEVNDYINSPYLSPSVSTTTGPLTMQGQDVFGTPDDMELYPTSIVTPSSPQAQPHLFFSDEDGEEDGEYDEEEEDEEIEKRAAVRNKIQMTPSGRRAKIHKCPYCNHTSNRANNMREHTQIHNPNRPKPHACKICNRAFARKHDMNRHHIACKKNKAGNNRYIVT
ncbi:uncharacterized protein EV154DRAFT_484575 [Mucor mucedo]|uniref:uncharacterized protein n=1 Tax=Mucor mucedo TaxID=29922 RepID=UPI0022210473|nr:uncharacterized protein EV154DRAFT_484575 [Mucor mucedo]KAI7887998.1 hypothetical protein EV154DRAFT_484575 [Mucor mucedo]